MGIVINVKDQFIPVGREKLGKGSILVNGR
jgi:hypothetical protein